MNGTQDSRHMNIQFIDRDFLLAIHENRISTIDEANRNFRIFDRLPLNTRHRLNRTKQRSGLVTRKLK